MSVWAYVCAGPLISTSSLATQVPAGRCYTRIALGPGGVIAASYDRCLHFIDSQSGRLLQGIDDAHDAAITQLAWRPEPASIGMVVAMYNWDYQLALFVVYPGALEAAVNDSGTAVRADEKQAAAVLATAGMDKRVRLWKAPAQ